MILVGEAGETRTQKIIDFSTTNTGVLNESQKFCEMRVSNESTLSDFSCYLPDMGCPNDSHDFD